MTRLFLHFWNASTTFKISQKEPVSQMCVVPFSNIGSWITFGPIWIRRLFYIWTTLLITVHTFAVIISLHIRKCAILFHLAWLNGKKLDFTLFYFYSHKGWTAALVRSLLSTSPNSDVSIVNCKSATSYNYDATIAFFVTAQQWTTTDATTIIFLVPPSTPVLPLLMF